MSPLYSPSPYVFFFFLLLYIREDGPTIARYGLVTSRSPEITIVITTASHTQIVKGAFVFHSELAFVWRKKEKSQADMPAFAHRNGRVSREVTSETQFAPSVLLKGSQVPAAPVAHAILASLVMGRCSTVGSNGRTSVF